MINLKWEHVFFHQRLYLALAKAFAKAAIVYKSNVASCCCHCENPGGRPHLGLLQGCRLVPSFRAWQ